MPYASNHGVRIHYKVEGEGPSLVLQHGLGGSLDDWYDSGYVEALKDDYQLILVDARGHGASDKPYDPQSYKMELRVADVVAVLDDLSVSKAHYLGYSMGGWIGWGIAKYAPERFHSLIIGGSQPYERDPDEPSPWNQEMIRLWRERTEVQVAAWERMFGQWWTPKFRARALTNDAEAIIAHLSLREYVGIEDILSTLVVPCLLFVGEADDSYSNARKCSEIIPNATFVSLPGLDHIDVYFRADLVLPHITKFLVEVNQV